MSDDLPTLGNPSRPDVGQQLQLEPDRAFLARGARFGPAGGAVGGGGEVDVAPAAPPAPGDDQPLAVLR